MDHIDDMDQLREGTVSYTHLDVYKRQTIGWKSIILMESVWMQ